MEFVGLQTQIWRNNTRSLLLLLLFPILLLGMLWCFLYIGNMEQTEHGVERVNSLWLQIAPFVIAGASLWFGIAWLFHSSMIHAATGARPLERSDNMRVYNLLENLCISRGVPMPKLYVLEDESLNAYASGISERSFAITVSRGMLNKLNDAELEGVLAHELTHILNRDVRLLIVSIIFVGIFSFIAQLLLRGGSRRGGKKEFASLIIALVISLIAWLISVLLQMAISRKREYMADAGAVMLTKNGPALASALEKIAGDPAIESVSRNDVAQLFIHHPKVGGAASFFNNLFSTHPPIEKRIEILRAW
jgi:heat shock protein HtpX